MVSGVSPIKILQISSATQIGGGERHIIDLARGLKRHDIETHFVIRKNSPLKPYLALDKVRSIELPLLNSLDIASAWKIQSYAKSNSIDLLHAHLGRDYTVAALASLLSGIPFLITRHVLFPLNRVSCLLLNKAHVIAVSDSVKKSLLAQGFCQQRVHVIRNGIDFRHKRVVKDRNSALQVGTVGNIDHVKGFMDLVIAASAVIKDMPEVQFFIAGEFSNEELVRSLQKKIHDLGINENVHLMGFVEDVEELLSSLDLYVSASESESFGLSILEAMANHVPVIATSTAGAKELIEDDHTGILVPLRSPQLLAESIKELLRDKERRARIAASAYDFSTRNFSVERMVDETLTLYRQVLKLC
jgi:L-malate glycosyltransferase